MKIDFFDEGSTTTRIVVAGVGGAGCNSVNRMIEAGVKGVDFVAINTDRQALKNSKAATKIVIGDKLTGGRGAGAIPEVGEKAAMEDEVALKDVFKGANMVFVTAGMGGGTGTGAAPVIARVAKEMNCLTIGVVTKPFDFEKTVKGKLAAEGITKLEKYVDTLIVISNQALLNNTSANISLMEAWHRADDVLKQGVQGISDLIINSGEINIDFADVQTVMKNKGKALMGVGIGKGENAAIEAVTMAIENPLMPDLVVDKAKSLLVNVAGSSKMPLKVYSDVMNFIQNIASDDALVINGQVFDDTLEDKVRVTIIATGFEEAEPAKFSTKDRTIEAVKEEQYREEVREEVKVAPAPASESRTDVYTHQEFMKLLKMNTVDDKSVIEEPTYIRMLNKSRGIGENNFLSKKE